MADGGELKIPAVRPVAESIIALTDHVCLELLDDEHADLAWHGVAKLARKRPSPIQSGRAPSRAGARATPEFLREDMIEASPAIWDTQVDGLIVDARALALPIQAQAFE